MASRAEEKRLRREEREAAEAAARAAASRQRTMQIAGVLVLVAVVAVAAVLLAGKGGSGSNNTANKTPAGGPQAPSDPRARIPAIKNTKLASASKAAGCVLLNPPQQGRSHVTTIVKYKSNPPTSGNHNPDPALDGVYDPGNTPTKEHFVHTLEHGRIELQYAPGTTKVHRLQLETLLAEPFGNHPGGYKMLLFENNTNMPYAVAATAWTHLIGCKTFTPKVFDALRDFRDTYVDKAPENSIPPNDL